MKQIMLVVSILKVTGLLQPRNITLLSSSCDSTPFDIIMLRSFRISLILGQSQMRDRFSWRRSRVSKLAPLTERIMILNEMCDHCIVI